ncbi:uncharacterized protein LOC113279524 [Papaver somniferum]|uniref:uncharacterized protein LOC113279524 n=1 Tax=Papaver somniferum TaxID=3469 RepID=UPI000E6F582D|nr:uncharacterized protein LOC113279524 [Papaver somniferum]
MLYPKVPSIDLPDDLFEEALNPWKFSLIGRLNLQFIKFVDAAVILRQQWKLSGDCKLIPLGRGFFTIKLDNELDRIIIKAGQWEVLNQVLQVRNWSSNFRPSAQRTSKAQVWVRLPGLGLEFWKEKILFKICKEIGTPIKIDAATEKCESGYYANVLVEMDFAQPIPSKIWIGTKYGGFFQDISTQILPKYCHYCKIIGHVTADCRISQSKSNAASSESQKNKTQVPFDICDRPEVESSPSKLQASTSNSVHQHHPVQDSLVTNITTPATKDNSSAINPGLVGGRFNILNSEDNKEEEEIEKTANVEIPTQKLLHIAEVTELEMVQTSAVKKLPTSNSKNNILSKGSAEQAIPRSKTANEVVKNIVPGNTSGGKIVNPVPHKYTFRKK